MCFGSRVYRLPESAQTETDANESLTEYVVIGCAAVWTLVLLVITAYHTVTFVAYLLIAITHTVTDLNCLSRRQSIDRWVWLDPTIAVLGAKLSESVGSGWDCGAGDGPHRLCRGPAC